MFSPHVHGFYFSLKSSVSIPDRDACSLNAGSVWTKLGTEEGWRRTHIHTGRVWVKTYYDVPWQVDAICHGADFFEGVEHGPVGAAHGPPVLVLGVTEFIKTSCACSLWWKIHCNCISREAMMTLRMWFTVIAGTLVQQTLLDSDTDVSASLLDSVQKSVSDNIHINAANADIIISVSANHYLYMFI